MAAAPALDGVGPVALHVERVLVVANAHVGGLLHLQVLADQSGRGASDRVRIDERAERVVQPAQKPFPCQVLLSLRLHGLSGGDLARRAGHDINRLVVLAHRREDVFVAACRTRRARVRRLVPDDFARVEDVLNLALKRGGKFLWITQVEKVLPDRIRQRQPPQIEQRLVRVQEPPVPVEDVGKVHDRREGRVEDARLLGDDAGEQVALALGQHPSRDVEYDAVKATRLFVGVSLDAAARQHPGDFTVCLHDAVLSLIVRPGAKRGANLLLHAGAIVRVDGGEVRRERSAPRQPLRHPVHVREAGVGGHAIGHHIPPPSSDAAARHGRSEAFSPVGLNRLRFHGVTPLPSRTPATERALRQEDRKWRTPRRLREKRVRGLRGFRRFLPFRVSADWGSGVPNRGGFDCITSPARTR